MKIENAKPGVEVVDKELGTTCTIRGVTDGLVYIEESAFPIYLRRFRLAKKTRRGELVKRIEELENRVSDLKAQRDRYAQKAHDIRNGTYFSSRPQREKWQMVANLTGWWITCDHWNDVRVWTNGPMPTFNEGTGCFHTPNYGGYKVTGTWTDEPFEQRIVGPQGGGGEAK